jgi:hypothetical protein
MADFCAQCSIDMFGKDYGDLRGITTSEDVEAGLYAVVICEGCGHIQVDVDGHCITGDCLRKGHK